MKRFLTFIVILTFAALFMTGCEERTKREAAIETPPIDLGEDFDKPGIFIDLWKDYNYDAIAVGQKSIDIKARCYGDIVSVNLVNKTTRENFNGIYDKDNGTCPIDGVVLQLGDNELEAAVKNDRGGIHKQSVLVTYNPSNVFIGNLKLSKDGVIEGVSDNITFTVGISKDTADFGDIQLVIYDNATDKYQTLTPFSDDGSPLNGDEAAGDGIYSAILNTVNMKMGKYIIRAQANVKGTANYSTSMTLLVAESDILEKSKKMIDTLDEIDKKYFNQSLKNLSSEELQQYKAWALKEISKLPNVKETNLSSKGDISMVFYPNFNVAIPAWTFHQNTNGNGDALSVILQTERGRNSIKPYNELYHKLTDGTNFQYKIENKDENIIWSNKVMNCRIFPFS